MDYKYAEIQARLDEITKECLVRIKKLMEDHQDKIVHFEEENACWINLDGTEQQVRSVTCFLIYNNELYFVLEDEEFSINSIPVPLLNSFSVEAFLEIINATFNNHMYKADEHTDAVEAVDMLHMVEFYYNEDK